MCVCAREIQSHGAKLATTGAAAAAAAGDKWDTVEAMSPELEASIRGAGSQRNGRDIW